jgi:hypothetical protein
MFFASGGFRHIGLLDHRRPVRSGEELLTAGKTIAKLKSGSTFCFRQLSFRRESYILRQKNGVSVWKELSDGRVADKNYVWFSEWQLQNINSNHLLPIDLEA